MDNPSFRVFVHSGSTSRTFLVEDFVEDEFGQWAMDEVTGQQGSVGDEGSCFWTWNKQQQVCLAMQSIQKPQIEEQK